MKKKKVIAFIGVFLIFTAALCFACNIFASGAAKGDCNYSKSKASRFQEAINEFGAISPEQSVNLWAKGVRERNGALQYAVMDEKLKLKFSNYLDKNRPSWVTGGSSPWIETYEIKLNKVDTSTYKVEVIFSLATSAGSLGSYPAYLQIVKQGNYWMIKDIQMDEKLRQYLNYPK
ncbi:MAG: hypothetical protein BWY74_00123 [Firmicutes bacterium ADurb.Bin419]|nr:MAG: hypothetical protein BWY74_00123 [Firmicutes bacterium ADurb.Bin419]